MSNTKCHSHPWQGHFHKQKHLRRDNLSTRHGGHWPSGWDGGCREAGIQTAPTPPPSLDHLTPEPHLRTPGAAIQLADPLPWGWELVSPNFLSWGSGSPGKNLGDFSGKALNLVSLTQVHPLGPHTLLFN